LLRGTASINLPENYSIALIIIISALFQRALYLNEENYQNTLKSHRGRANSRRGGGQNRPILLKYQRTCRSL